MVWVVSNFNNCTNEINMMLIARSIIITATINNKQKITRKCQGTGYFCHIMYLLNKLMTLGTSSYCTDLGYAKNTSLIMILHVQKRRHKKFIIWL